MPKLSAKGDTFTEIIVEIFRLNGLILGAGDRIAGPVGLTSARGQVLGGVEHGPMSVASVARHMGLSRQTVQQTANGLEHEGFIEFVDNPHHLRAKLMQLTEKGEEALVYVREQQAIWSNGIGDAHDLEGMRRALETLRGLKGSLEADPLETVQRKPRAVAASGAEVNAPETRLRRRLGSSSAPRLRRKLP